MKVMSRCKLLILVGESSHLFSHSLHFPSSRTVPMARLIDFTLQCKILEESDKPFSAETAKLVSDELNQALLDLHKRGSSSSSLRPRTPIAPLTESFEPLATSTSRISSIMDVAVDTVICRVMFVFYADGIHYTKCSLETSQDVTLKEMLRAISAKARRPAQLCRVFSCDKLWGKRKEIDLHETGKKRLMDIPSTKPNRLNFIVDYVNTLTEEGRPAPFDLNETKNTKE